MELPLKSFGSKLWDRTTEMVAQLEDANRTGWVDFVAAEPRLRLNLLFLGTEASNLEERAWQRPSSTVANILGSLCSNSIPNTLHLLR